jgi:hypothetical protein
MIKQILSLKYTCSLNMPSHIHAEQSHQANLKKEKNKTKERKHPHFISKFCVRRPYD